MLNYMNVKEVLKGNDLNKTDHLRVSNYVFNEKTQNESHAIAKP